MAAPMALAQQAEVQKGERIEITGTRIPSPNLESSSPVTVISAQDIKFEGVTRVEDMLNSLPQVFADFGANLSNGATGTATVNLRGLGAVRTLVLMNGKRLPIGSPQPFTANYPPDLNQIPAPLIQRIEVLTGGASAVYGSDAVAGVVNFIMRDNFEGVQGDVNYSWYQHNQHSPIASIVAGREATNPSQFRVPGDLSSAGESTEVSLLLGGNFGGGKGNATVFFDYKKDKPLQQSDYDYSACATGVNAAGTAFTCGGSSTTGPGGRFVSLTNGANITINSATGGVRNFNASLDQFNFAPYNYYQRPDERYGFAAFAHYDVNPHARVYTEFNYHDSHTLAQIAPSGSFFGNVVFTLGADNPLLSSAFRNAVGITADTPAELFIGRRNLEGGGRIADLRHNSGRAVVGVKGDIMKNWDYDVYMQTARVVFQQTYRNDFSNIRLVRALDVVADPTTGAPVCRSVLDGTDLNCVPYNIFTLGGVTPAALAYVSTPGLQKGETVQRIQGGTLSTDLGNYGWRFPGAKQGIGLAIGAERRVEKLSFEADVAFNTGDLAGQGGPTQDLAGQFTVKDFFGELRVPIRDFISVNGSYRYSDYSTGKTTDSYGLGIELSPVKTFKIRGSYQQAVRAGNVIELFATQGLGLFNMATDPCGVDPALQPVPTATAAQCARSGLSAANYGSTLLISPAGQYNALFGGNPDVNPETAKTYTAGIVWTPMRNLSATVDYYDITVEDVISSVGVPSALAVTQCIFSNQFCDLINRDPRTGALWVQGGFVSATTLNAGSLRTSGIDVAINYNHNLGRWGGLGLSFSGTYIEKFINEPLPGFGSYDCAGYYGATCGTPTPQWRHKLRAIWSAPWNFDLAVTWRHMDSVKLDASSSAALLTAPFAPITETLGARDYLDLSLTWNVWKRVALRFGVNNVFDRDPPVCDSTSVCGPPFGNGNAYPQVYDALGRKFFTGLTVNF
jgi:outer membrane receptor protein involved in Fe transport